MRENYAVNKDIDEEGMSVLRARMSDGGGKEEGRWESERRDILMGDEKETNGASTDVAVMPGLPFAGECQLQLHSCLRPQSRPNEGRSWGEGAPLGL